MWTGLHVDGTVRGIAGPGGCRCGGGVVSHTTNMDPLYTAVISPHLPACFISISYRTYFLDCHVRH